MHPYLPHLKILRNTFLFVLISLIIASCHCDDMICEGLKPELETWITRRVGDSIKFTNGAGNEILFKVSDYQITVTKNVDCRPSGIGCYCPNCEDPMSSYNANTTDTSRAYTDSMGVPVVVFMNMSNYIRQNGGVFPPKQSFSYNVFDHSNTFNIDSNFNLQLNYGDTLLPTFTVGARTYDSVIVHETDTTIANPYYPHLIHRYFVIKSYYNKEYGVIAFYDQLTQSLFYRED